MVLKLKYLSAASYKHVFLMYQERNEARQESKSQEKQAENLINQILKTGLNASRLPENWLCWGKSSLQLKREPLHLWSNRNSWWNIPHKIWEDCNPKPDIAEFCKTLYKYRGIETISINHFKQLQTADSPIMNFYYKANTVKSCYHRPACSR